MLQRPLSLVVTLCVLAACAKHDAPEGASDSLISASTTAAPTAKIPHVIGLELGRALDSANSVMGGMTTSYHQGDTIFVSIRTEYVPEGAALGARLLRGNTTVDSTGLKTGAMNAMSQATMGARFVAPAKGWAVGAYRVEIFLDSLSQGLKEFEVIK